MAKGRGQKASEEPRNINQALGEPTPAPERTGPAPVLTGTDGEPLQLYVGTPYEGELTPEDGHEYGIYLTPRIKYARTWARATEGKVRHFTAQARNPLYVENKGEISPRDLMAQDIEKLRAQGYDAIVSTSSTLDAATEVVLFDSDQITEIFVWAILDD